MRYPILLEPENFEVIHREGYCLPERPTEPILNGGIPNSSDAEPGSFHTAISLISSMLLLFCGAMFFFGSVPSMASGKGDMQEMFFPLLLIVSVSAFVLFRIERNRKDKEQQYKDALAEYYSRQKDHRAKMTKFKSEEQSYQLAVDKFQRLTKSEQKKAALRKFYARNTIQPSPYITHYKEGKAERMFYEKLKELFGDFILKYHTILPEYQEMKEEDGYYLPDVCYYNNFSGICVDIEIDEMFTKSTGQVIHDSSNSHDRRRNSFFQSNGWFVLRFTESQVNKDILGCAVVLLQLLRQHDPGFHLIKQETIDLLWIRSAVYEELRWDAKGSYIYGDSMKENHEAFYQRYQEAMWLGLSDQLSADQAEYTSLKTIEDFREDEECYLIQEANSVAEDYVERQDIWEKAFWDFMWGESAYAFEFVPRDFELLVHFSYEYFAESLGFDPGYYQIEY